MEKRLPKISKKTREEEKYFSFFEKGRRFAEILKKTLTTVTSLELFRITYWSLSNDPSKIQSNLLMFMLLPFLPLTYFFFKLIDSLYQYFKPSKHILCMLSPIKHSFSIAQISLFFFNPSRGLFKLFCLFRTFGNFERFLEPNMWCSSHQKIIWEVKINI